MHQPSKKRPKVLHLLADPLPGGIEVFLLNLLKFQAGNKSADSVVVCIMDSDHPASLRDEYEKVAGFYDLDCRSFFSKRFSTRIHDLIKKEKPDVIHAWGYDVGLVAGLIARYVHRIKVVWAIHALDLPSRHMYSALRFHVLKAVVGMGSRFIPHQIISCSDAGTETHVKFGYPRKHCVTIPNGIDTDRFTPNKEADVSFRQELAIPVDAPVIGYIGRSHPVKDLETLFAAIGILMQKRDDIHFVGVGIDPDGLYPSAAEVYNRLPDRSRIHLVGNRPDIENCIPSFTVNVLSSKSEAMPMVLIEALCCGVPCVSTDVGAAKTILGPVGRCVPAGNPQRLADTTNNLMDQVMDDQETWASNARQHVLKHFGIAETARRHTEIYASLAGIKPSRARFPRVMHLVNDLDFGGAEMMLNRLACGLHLQDFDQTVVSVIPPGRLAASFTDAGIPVKSLEVKNMFSGIAGVFRLAALIRQQKPDILQTWMYHSALIGEMAALLSFRFPKVIWSIHHTRLDKKSSKFGTRVIHRILALISGLMPERIIYCSKASADIHSQDGFDVSKEVLISNGTDTDMFRPDTASSQLLRRELGIPADAPVIGMVGRNDPLKDYPNLLRAFAILQKTDDSVHLVACGSNVTLETPALSALVQACPDPSRVHLLGPRPDMQHVYPAFTLLALASTQEAFPLVLGEAMSCAVPCVATDVGDCALIIGDCGQIVPVGDSVALAEGIKKLLQRPPSEILLLGQQARQRVVQHFALGQYIQSHANLYLKLASVQEGGALEPHRDTDKTPQPITR